MKVRWWLTSTLLALVALGSTNVGAPSVVRYRINTPSLTSSGAFGGSDPTRAIELAGHSWLWSAGARRYFASEGQTTSAGCGFFNPNHVFGVPGFDPLNPSQLGFFFYCPLGGWIIQNWMGAPANACSGCSWTLSATPTTQQWDFQAHIQHEFGHDTTPFHVNNPQCVMNASLGSGDRRRWFCSDDIETVAGNGHGHATSSTTDALSVSAWPFPGTSGWYWWPNGSGFEYGLGFGGYQRGRSGGTSVDKFFKSDTRTASHPIQSCAVPGVCVGVTGLGTNGTQVIHAPAAAFDYSRNVWWIFWLDSWDRINAAKSADGVNFTNYGTVLASKWVFVNGVWVNQLSNPTSRVPVGASYNQVNDQLVIAYSNWAGVSGSNSGGRTFDINFLTFNAASPTSSVWSGPFSTAVRSDMPPAVGCENAYTYYNCQLLTSEATNPSRSVFAWGADFYSSGELRATTVAQDTGGLSNYPPSLTFAGPTSAGRMVGAVSGASLCGDVWLIHKKWANDPWTGWQVINGGSCTVFGPRIGVSEESQSYGIVHGL